MADWDGGFGRQRGCGEELVVDCGCFVGPLVQRNVRGAFGLVLYEIGAAKILEGRKIGV